MKVTVETSLDELFNAFIADELWAALNYKNAAFVSKGKALKFSNGIFEDNSDEEFEHMEELVDMAQSLGIKVKVNPKDAEKNCTTPYVDLTSDEDTKKLVKIFLSSERAAISGYQTALKNKNVLEKPELCQFFGEICNDEHNHLKELLDLASNVGVKDGLEKDDVEADGTTDAADDLDDGDDENSSEDDSDGMMSISPLTGIEQKKKASKAKKSDGKSEDDDEDADDSEEDDENSSGDSDDTEKDDDSDEENDDKDDDGEDDEDEEEVTESAIPCRKSSSSVRNMLKMAFSNTSKKVK